MTKKWWKEAVVYQIYPRSFKDSNGDGIGDLRGIIEKLDYLKELGIDVIWLNPCYASPNDDNGYDISDYYQVMPEFGTMEDFDELLAEAHKRGIKIVMDLVVNHSSDEHKWFIESRSSKDNPYRDYYIWRDPRDGKEPNNWGSFFSPSAWEYDEKTGQYYLHLFSKKQPDLNWEHEPLRQEVYKMMNFWFDKGIDGFRMDVINLIKKPIGLPDSKLPHNTAEGYVFDPDLYANNPGLLEFLQEMNRNVMSKYDCMTVGETVNVTPEIALNYVKEENKALNMVFHFEIMEIKENFDLVRFKEIQQKWYDGVMKKGGWNSQYLNNHDQPRQVSIFGNDKEYRLESAKLLGTMLHTLPGTPYIYQGEEIGMTNCQFTSIDEFNDIHARYLYSQMLKKGTSSEEALSWLNNYSREHARTPMHWDNTENAGFTTGKPWLKINPNYHKINVKDALKDPNSVFYHYKKLIALRKANEVMVYGDFHDLTPTHKEIFAYTRSLNGVEWLIALNFTSDNKELDLGRSVEGKVVLSNYPDYLGKGQTLNLRPYEAVIIEK
ncbi:MAG: alpha-glucosidase [Clostridiaceae bacterium]|nr:alpha-glucosidase [Clostridiaceae bacterium]